MKNKIIELNELEQRNLFCVAWHLTNFIEDCKEDKVASFSTPCETCKYQKECFKEDGFIYPDAFSPFETLTKLTGVIITPLNDARKNGFNFLIDEAKDLVTISEVVTKRTGNLGYLVNDITREMDSYLKYQSKDFVLNNYIYDKYNDAWSIRCTGATRGHIKVDENDVIQKIVLYEDSDGIYKPEVRSCFDKYIGMKIVVEECSDGMQTCKR